jgi:hypothetical protein
MYEAILESFSFFPTLVVTNGSTLMTAEGLNIIHFFAIALIVALLTARIASKKDRAIFKRQRIATLKKCPKCAEQLPLSALVCDACDYNFLSRMVRRRHELLPSPSEPLAHHGSPRGSGVESHIGEESASACCLGSQLDPGRAALGSDSSDLVFVLPLSHLS